MRSIKFGMMMLLMMLATTSFAQQKFGYINSLELLSLMPEVKTADAELEAYAKTLKAKLAKMEQEFADKYLEVQKMQQEGEVTEAILEAEIKVLASLENKITQYRATTNQELQVKQNELYEPILAKATKAVQDVAKKHGYSYIFDTSTGALVYAPEGDNIIELVKTELGIQ